MKRITLFLVVMLFSFAIFAQKNEVKIKLKADENSFEVINKGMQNLTVKSSLSALYFSEAKTKGGDFTLLQANGLIKIFDMGSPNIPVISKLIEVPQDAKVKINIVSYDEQIFNLADYGIMNKIVPAQRSISKSEDPVDVPFAYDENIYSKDGFVNTSIATYEDAGMMRATRLGRLEISPIQYNPVKNQVRVLNNLVVEIEFVGANLSKTDELKTKYASPYFDNILESQVINYEKANTKELIGAPTHMVIVSDRMFEAQLQEFIDWKELKGFDVTVGYTDDIGTTTTDIKAYLQAIYEGADPMEFVLFVGDVQQIPAWSGTSGSHISDLYYSLYTGDDLLPEVYYGRFSAQTTAQLQPQIDKTLMYEQYTMADPSYLGDQVLIAGVDAGNAPVYGNGAINYISENYANSDNGVNPLTYLYDDAANSTVMTSDNSGAPASINSYMSQGVGWANYTAHCSPSGWADPSFETSEVANLQNDQKYGLWIGNCCLSVKFDESECFGEAALRKANAGAIGDIGGSNSTYWDEDYWWATGVGTCVENPLYENFGLGSYDAVYHTKANEVNDISKWFVTQSQVNTVGQLAVEGSSSTRKTYYWEIYHLMGDPTVMNYLGVPDAITYTLNPAVLMIGASSTEISTVPYGYIAVHQGGNRLCVAMADENGDATLNFSSAIVGGDVTLVITAQNKQPLIETITPIPLDAPYIALNNYTTSATPDFGTSITLDVTLENLATSGSGYDATNVSAVLSITDDYVTITDNTADYGNMVAGATATQSGAYGLDIANDVPDGYVFEFALTITADEGTWTSTITVTANAPEISIGAVSIANDDNADGIFDAGESADILYEVTNSGSATANFDGVLSESSDPNNYLTLGGTSVSGIAIAPGETVDFTFAGATADASTPLGTSVEVQLDVTIGAEYADVSNDEIIIGLIPIFPISDGGTITTCTGTFYDSGLDAGQYGSDEDYTMTFLAPNGEYTVVDFIEFATEGGYDYLHVHDGPDVSYPEVPGSPFDEDAPPTAALSGANGLTFHFTSDGSVSRDGWVAEVSCFSPTEPPACASNPMPADGGVAVVPTSTLSWSAPFATSYELYFGTDPDPMTNTPVTLTDPTYSPVMAEVTTYYWTVIASNENGAATGCETWSFTTSEEEMVMQEGTFTVCSGLFTDSGGSNGQYSNGENITMTLLPGEAGKVIEAIFVDGTTIEGCCDELHAYDGVDATAPEFAGSPYANSDGVNIGTLTASNSDGAITFVFTSDGSVTKDGWLADISCVFPTDVFENGLSNISVYPNPTTGIFNIDLPANSEVKISVIDITGKTIYEAVENKTTTKVDLRNNSKGVYILKLQFDEQTITKKIIVE